MKKILLSLLFFPMFIIAQEKLEVDTIAVKSIDGIVNEVLRMISGEDGKERDWEGFRSLFLPTAQFTVLYQNDSIPVKFETLNLEEFVRLAGAQYQSHGFIERELHKRVDEYNGIAQVFQSYYAKDMQWNYEEKGINSYQLIYLENRWWVVNILWTSDHNGVEIPNENLK